MEASKSCYNRLNKSMRIALFTDTYYPDLNGVVISVDNYAHELRKKGHKVFIFAPKIKGKYKDEDPDLIRLPSLKILKKTEPQIHSPLPWFNKEFNRIFLEDYDIIHAHGNGPYSVLGLLASKVKRVPFVMTFHTVHSLYTHYIFGGRLIKPHHVEMFLKLFANRCSLILTVSEKMKNELQKYGVKKEIYVTPNFLDLKRFTNLKKGFLHKLLKLPSDVKLVTTVGRIGEEKNIDFLLRVFKIVYSENSNVHLVIIGQGPEKENLEKLTSELGISNRVHFTGKISYDFMPQAYFDSCIFLFSSVSETQGIVVLEADAAGTPVVVSDDSAFKNMVYDNKNGFALPLNEDKFAHKILELLEDNKLREDMSNEAKKIAFTDFDPSALTAQLINLYEQAISKRKKQ